MTTYPTTPGATITRAEIERLKAREAEARKIMEGVIVGGWRQHRSLYTPMRYHCGYCGAGYSEKTLVHIEGCPIGHAHEWLKAPEGDAALVASVAELEAPGRADGE